MMKFVYASFNYSSRVFIAQQLVVVVDIVVWISNRRI